MHNHDPERLREFEAALDAIRTRVEAHLGPRDVAYIKKVNRFSHAMGGLGRVLIHFSLDPLTFTAGVGALWVHKVLQTTEVGHTVLHGIYDGLPGAERYTAKRFRWKLPVHTESWRYVHNRRHHGFTNIAGRDPDMHFGPIRLTKHTPFNPKLHPKQMVATAVLWAHFAAAVNVQDTGLREYYRGNGRPEEFDFIKERTPKTRATVWRKALRGYLPHYGRELVLFPALAGWMFWKVVLGNMLAEVLRDLYISATIFCGHVGDDLSTYPEGTRAGNRANWYVMQIEASGNFEVPRPVSILCGGLDCHIEHHIFPQLPPNRLREIVPEVRAVCEKYGIKYTSDTWGKRLRVALRRLRQLSRPDADYLPSGTIAPQAL